MTNIKKLSGLVLAAVLCSSVVCVLAQTPASDAQLAIAKYGTPEEIDGKLDSGWDGANTYTNTNFVGSETNETDIEAEWKVMYDNAYLYFFVNITDSTIGDAEYEYDENGNYYAKNSIHLMFDLGYERGTFYDDNDFYIDISSQGYYNNHTEDAFDFVYYATTLTDDGYSAEIRVDFDYYTDFAAEEGTCIGFDLWANDNLPTLPGRMFARTWNDTSDSCWNNPSMMGTVQLGEKPADAAVTEKNQIERVIVTYPNIDEDKLPELRPGENLADFGAALTAITNMSDPQGGGSRDISVIIDGNLKGDGSAQYDTYHATATDDTGKNWYGVEFDKAYAVSSVVFVEGGHWGDGGWFGAAPTLQLLIDGTWTDASANLTPDYPGDSLEEQGAINEAYIFTLDNATECSGVRVMGDPNSLEGHTSCAEVQVFGSNAGTSTETTAAETEETTATVETEPETEAVAETEPVAEAQEENVSTEPAETSGDNTELTAPQTSDSTLVLLTITAVLSLGVCAATKKKVR